MAKLEEALGTCPVCGPVKKVRKGTNHIFHLILTLLTAGIWLIVWLLSMIKLGGWRCEKCHRKIS